MAKESYTVHAIVLRKTKLGESDLIVTLLSEDGSQIRAVARGARKPTSSFASRLEVCSVCKVLCVRGRSLDIVKEVRIIAGHNAIRADFDRMMLANCIMEMLSRITQVALELPALFAVTIAALNALDEANRESAYALTFAHMLKVFAFVGVKPEFMRCVLCERNLMPQNGIDKRTYFSFKEGGVLCLDCAASRETEALAAGLIGWFDVLLYSSFAQIVSFGFPRDAHYKAFDFCRRWTQAHLGFTIKSIGVLMSLPGLAYANEQASL